MTETTDQMSPQEQAEAFVTEQIASERASLTDAIARDSLLEQAALKEHEANDAAYWKLSKRDLDGEPDAEEVAARRKADASLRKLQGISAAISNNREKLARLDDSFSRRVRTKREQLERGRNGGSSNGKEGKTKVAKTETKRTPVPEATIKRVVELVKTKSQQEVADLLNKEGKTTASGKPWTPQNIWHLVYKATGKGVPRKASRNGSSTRKKSTSAGSKKKTAAAKKKKTTAKRQAKPLSKQSQARGTSRGGSGSRKRTTARRRSR